MHRFAIFFFCPSLDCNLACTQNMAPVSGKESDEFLGASQAAALRSNDYCFKELCDNLLNSITTNIKICEYTDPTASSLNFDDNRSCMLTFAHFIKILIHCTSF